MRFELQLPSAAGGNHQGSEQHFAPKEHPAGNHLSPKGTPGQGNPNPTADIQIVLSRILQGTSQEQDGGETGNHISWLH